MYSIYTGYIGREGLCQLCGPLGNKDWPDPHYGLSPSLYAGARAARLDLYVDNPEPVISVVTSFQFLEEGHRIR